MRKILVYGTGNTYTQINPFIRQDKCEIIGFIESKKGKEIFEGKPVYTPECAADNKECDFILIASVDFEKEMTETLINMNVPKEKIIPGNLEYINIIRNPELFDVNKYIVWQNNEIQKKQQEIIAQNRTILAQNRFNEMRKGVPWLTEETQIIGGGWAVGYYYMYIMLHILLSKKPKSILEMGLGQSSKILINYHIDSNADYEIIEQNEEWLSFFSQENYIPEDVKVHIRPVQKEYSAQYGTDIYTYGEIQDIVRGKYDLISIDGPWGSKGISRKDILPYIPECLEDSFCILLDDYGREGEKNMISELEKILKDNGIEYHKRVYHGDKQFCLIVSKDNLFLCSL
ncbi:MAG: hypothetical protein J1F18_15375 [Lachnospiraceae bacterium]|nr:hypothetical protein [Lachnospiraceae bacterium]